MTISTSIMDGCEIMNEYECHTIFFQTQDPTLQPFITGGMCLFKRVKAT